MMRIIALDSHSAISFRTAIDGNKFHHCRRHLCNEFLTCRINRPKWNARRNCWNAIKAHPEIWIPTNIAVCWIGPSTGITRKVRGKQFLVTAREDRHQTGWGWRMTHDPAMFRYTLDPHHRPTTPDACCDCPPVSPSFRSIRSVPVFIRSAAPRPVTWPFRLPAIRIHYCKFWHQFLVRLFLLPVSYFVWSTFVCVWQSKFIL